MSNRRKPNRPRLAPVNKGVESPFTPLLNGYKCEACGGAWLTVDLDKGTTPMFSPCFRTEGCDGRAVSMGYPLGPPPKGLPLLIEWYRPESVSGLDPVLLDHAMRGGLLRRATTDAPAWVKALA